MKKWVKRLSAMLLVIMMVLTLVPNYAYAAPGRGKHGGWRWNDAAEQTTSESVTDVNEEVQEETASVSMPAQSFDQVLEGTNIQVHVDAPENAFPEGTTMELSAPEQAAVDAALGAVENATNIVAVDITFRTSDGIETQPLTDIDVQIKTPEIAEAGSYSLVHVDDNNNAEIVQEEKIESINEDGAKFETDAFSTYAIVSSDGTTVTTIHYGTLEGDTFTEFEDSMAVTLDTTGSSVSIATNFEFQACSCSI